MGGPPKTDAAAWRRALSPVLEPVSFPPSAQVTVEIAASSDRGRERPVNEDHYLVVRLGRVQETLATSLARADVPERFEESAYAFFVADGLGGTGGGAVASRIALSTITHMAIHFGRWNLRVDPRIAEEIMDRAVWFYSRAHNAILERARTEPALSGMATTLTAGYSVGWDLFIANVGHSRAYMFRTGTLTQLTRDQTLAERMLDRPGPAPVDRATQDLRHILTDTMGGKAMPLVEIEHFRLADGDVVLVCTDGLTDMLSSDEIADVLALRRSSEEQCRALIDCAMERGGRDNLTVVLAQYRVPPA